MQNTVALFILSHGNKIKMTSYRNVYVRETNENIKERVHVTKVRNDKKKHDVQDASPHDNYGNMSKTPGSEERCWQNKLTQKLTHFLLKLDEMR